MARRGDGIYQRGETWWLDFVHQGKRCQARLGRGINRTVARELASVKRAAFLKGEEGIGRKRRDISFEKATAEFLQWARANRRPATAQSYASCIRRLGKSFNGKSLGQIHTFLVEKHRQTRLTEGARIGINRELTCLKALFNRCIDWKKFEGENPLRKVKLFKESTGRTRHLNQDEEQRLLMAAKEPVRTVILTGIYAGLRVRSEALTLRRADVDLKLGLLTVQAAYAKSGESRTVPINSVLREALGRILSRAPASDYVFTKKDGKPFRSIRTAFATACRHAKLADVTPHVLRHTFASKLAMAGVDLRTIQELGGWKELKMVERYAHLHQSHKAAAVEKIVAESTTVITTAVEAPSAPSLQVVEK